MIAELSLMAMLAGAQTPAGLAQTQAQTQAPPAPVIAAPKPAPAPVPASGAKAQAPGVPAPPPPAALVGFWEGEATSRGGIGTALLINADGSCEFTVLVKVDFKYTYDAGKLIFAADGQGTPETTLEATLTGDTLVVKPPVGEAITKTRVGTVEDAERPILGVWRYPHATGGTAWERYGVDGTMLFRLATTERPSTCTVTGGRLAIVSPQMKTDARFDVKGDELRLFGASDEARLFRRIAGGRWYGKSDLTPPK
jgi:hypothetical protein